jgi:gamma-glutamylcysteine synthetase
VNKDRRKKLDEIYGKLEELKDEVNNLCDEEQTYFDGMPENMQNAEKGEIAQAAVNNMTEAVGHLEDAMTGIEEAKE